MTLFLYAASNTRATAEEWGRIVLLSFIIGLVSAAIVCGIIIYKYKKKLKSPIYPLERYARLSLSDANTSDIFAGKSVTRVRINNSSRATHGRR